MEAKQQSIGATVNPKYQKVPIKKIITDIDFTIRHGLNQDAILRYRELLREKKSCPALKVQNGTMRVIDGWHRLQAAKEEGIEELGCELLDVPDSELRALAYRFNAKHGVPLSLEERNKAIVDLHTKDGKTQQHIADITGLSQGRISQLLAILAPNESNIDLPRERQVAMVKLILKGETQEQIAKTFDVTHGYVSQVKSKWYDAILKAYEGSDLKREIAERFGFELSEVDAILQSFGDPLNFELITTTWWPAFGLDDRFGKENPSNLPANLIRNILALYTKPGDIILDPAAGGGVVLDVTKDMVNRKCFAYDLIPKRDDIKTHNILVEPPSEPEKPDLIFLDLPYGPMKEYSQAHSSDLANLSLQEFLEYLTKIFGYWDSGTLVTLMSSYKGPEGFVDLPFEAEKRMVEAGWRIVEHIVNEHGHRTQSETGFWIETAKKERWLLRRHIHVLVGVKP